MNLHRIVLSAAVFTALLTAGPGTVGVAHATDEIANSVAGVIDGDGPEVSGDLPPASTPRKRTSRSKSHHDKSGAATPIWEQDGPPINRSGVNGF
jgi:hypothetical protein